MISLVIPGRPVGKQRPRFNRQTGRTYTPTKTVAYEQRIHTVWEAQGRPRLDDGPLHARITACYERPPAHLRVKGGLTAAGQRQPYPMPQVDLDNLIKACLDALNGLAYRDDRQVVHVEALRRWCQPDEHEHVRITVRNIEGDV